MSRNYGQVTVYGIAYSWHDSPNQQGRCACGAVTGWRSPAGLFLCRDCQIVELQNSVKIADADRDRLNKELQTQRGIAKTATEERLKLVIKNAALQQENDAIRQQVRDMLASLGEAWVAATKELAPMLSVNIPVTRGEAPSRAEPPAKPLFGGILRPR